MSTLYRIDEEGGFTVADTAEDMTAYAEPTSANAAQAAAGRAGTIAENMIALEELRRWQRSRPASSVKFEDESWADIRATASLERGLRDGSTVREPDDSNMTHVREGRQEARYHAREQIDEVRWMYPHYDPNRAGSAAMLDSVRDAWRREMDMKYGPPVAERVTGEATATVGELRDPLLRKPNAEDAMSSIEPANSERHMIIGEAVANASFEKIVHGWLDETAEPIPAETLDNRPAKRLLSTTDQPMPPGKPAWFESLRSKMTPEQSAAFSAAVATGDRREAERLRLAALQPYRSGPQI